MLTTVAMNRLHRRHRLSFVAKNVLPLLVVARGLPCLPSLRGPEATAARTAVALEAAEAVASRLLRLLRSECATIRMRLFHRLERRISEAGKARQRDNCVTQPLDHKPLLRLGPSPCPLRALLRLRLRPSAASASLRLDLRLSHVRHVRHVHTIKLCELRVHFLRQRPRRQNLASWRKALALRFLHHGGPWCRGRQCHHQHYQHRLLRLLRRDQLAACRRLTGRTPQTPFCRQAMLRQIRSSRFLSLWHRPQHRRQGRWLPWSPRRSPNRVPAARTTR